MTRRGACGAAEASTALRQGARGGAAQYVPLGARPHGRAAADGADMATSDDGEERTKRGVPHGGLGHGWLARMAARAAIDDGARTRRANP
jgi:hypothetical protein